MSLRAYLARLADTLLTPDERAKRAEQGRRVLREWNGYDPDPQQEKDLDAVLDARLRQARTAAR